MHFAFLIAISTIGCSALVAIRLRHHESRSRSLQVFFVAAFLLVASATMIATLYSDPSWIQYAGLLSLMAIGSVVDFSSAARQAESF